MNILLYSLIYPPDVCSNAYVFADLTEEFMRRGHQVTVITTTPHYGGSSEGLLAGKKDWYKTSEFRGAKVYHICVGSEKASVREKLLAYYKFHRYAPKLLTEENVRADIVISQTPPPILVGHTAKKLGKRLDAKTVLILQDAWVDNLKRRKRIGLTAYRMLSRFEESVYNKQNAVVTLSEDMAVTVRRKLKQKDRIHIIPNPVNTDIYHPRDFSEDLKRKYSIGDTEFVVSYVGNLAAAQDLRPLISYVKRNPGIKALIAGNGKMEKQYREEAADCDRIVFLGYISREETTEVNAISDICMVMLSAYISDTCFPSKLPTLMAMGKPIALCCGADCGLANYVTENGIGLAADVNNPESFTKMMECFREDDELRKNCADKSYQVSMRDFSLQSIGERYDRLFRSLTD